MRIIIMRIHIENNTTERQKGVGLVTVTDNKNIRHI